MPEPTADPTQLRDRLAEALRTAPVRGTVMRMTVLTELYGPVDALADDALTVVQPELDQLRAERNCFRAAWQSARRRAEAWRGQYVDAATKLHDHDHEWVGRALYDQNVRAVHKENQRLVRLLGKEQRRADAAEAERDRAMAGVPLICSDERHHAKMRGLEAERDDLRAHHGQVADHAISLDADLAIFREAVSQYSGQLEEARDLLSNAGHNRAHVDDWPDITPALQELIAERDQLRAVARAAAVLLRATADRPSHPDTLRAAATAIDELAPKET